MKMQIMAYDRGPLILSDSISKDLLNFDDVNVQISMLIKYKAQNGLFGTQFSIRFVANNDLQVAEIGMMFSVYLEGWAEFIEKTQNGEEIVDFITRDTNVIENLLNATNAVVLERSVGTIIEGFFSPSVVDYDEFKSKAIQVEKVE